MSAHITGPFDNIADLVGGHTDLLPISELVADGHSCEESDCWWEEGFHRTPGGCCASCGTCGDPECCPGGCECRWPSGVFVALAEEET